MAKSGATIKGMFLNSHVRAVREALGPEGVRKLKACYGSRVDFRFLQEVPVDNEIRLISCTLMLLRPSVPQERREFEAGVLHFRNFSTTALGRLVLAASRRRIKTILLQSRYLAPRVFRGIRVATKDLGPKHVRLVMYNNEYPLEHFRGFFTAWVDWSGNICKVEAEASSRNTQEFDITWK
jgi:uncharacterized protein (TIGR02265 family)